MPEINWGDVEEAAGGEYRTPEPGGYVCRITHMEHVPEKEYYKVYWDVVDGEYAGCYEGSQYPPVEYMSYKQSALGYTKKRLHVLADSNPGFKPTVAFNGGDANAFVGKVFGAVLRKRLYTNERTGRDGEGIEIGTWKTPDEIRSGQLNSASVGMCM